MEELRLSKFLNGCLRRVMDVEYFMQKFLRITFPFGGSLLLVGQKPAPDAN